MAAMQPNNPIGPIALLAVVGGLACLAGCSSSGSTTQPATLGERQERALQDPYGYTPDLQNSDMSVSGHGEFDKEGFNRDKDFVLNP